MLSLGVSRCCSTGTSTSTRTEQSNEVGSFCFDGLLLRERILFGIRLISHDIRTASCGWQALAFQIQANNDLLILVQLLLVQSRVWV
jgi:hypothetical protein